MGSKRVSWASPLIESPIQHSPVRRAFSTVKQREPHVTSRDHRTAIESLRDTLRRQPPFAQHKQSSSRHDSLDVSDAVVISRLTDQERQNHACQEHIRTRYEAREEAEKARYAQRQHEREQQLLCRDAFYEAGVQAHSTNVWWSAACKFVDTLASRDTEPGPDYFFSKGELLVSLFVHCDLRFYSDKTLADKLLTHLIHDFPHVKNFRFAVFFPRQLVEEKSVVPEALRYLLGTLSYTNRTGSLEGATTDMEKKFVTRQHHYMRRCCLDPVEVHEDSLDKGILIPKVDTDDTNSVPIQSNLLQESPQSTGTQPINIVWPKAKDVEHAWKAPRQSFAWA
jgi:hypothetical protein